MVLFVSVLMMLLATSWTQVNPVVDGATESGEEQVPGSGDEQVPEETHADDISTDILNSNNKSSELLLEGDIQVSKRRNAMRCWFNHNCHWPKGFDGKVSIAYTVSREFGGHERRRISSALRELERGTCIRFVPHQRQADYISVENKGGCYSALGKQGGKQVLSLKRRGCVYKGIIQHEFLHALGFKHEQTRSDRDKYIRINWGNVQRSKAYNFHKSWSDNLNTPYDYSSVMHYGRTAFSKNGRETISPLFQANIGQRHGVSHWDIQRIKLLYNC